MKNYIALSLLMLISSALNGAEHTSQGKIPESLPTIVAVVKLTTTTVTTTQTSSTRTMFTLPLHTATAPAKPSRTTNWRVVGSPKATHKQDNIVTSAYNPLSGLALSIPAQQQENIIPTVCEQNGEPRIVTMSQQDLAKSPPQVHAALSKLAPDNYDLVYDPLTNMINVIVKKK